MPVLQITLGGIFIPVALIQFVLILPHVAFHMRGQEQQYTRFLHFSADEDHQLDTVRVMSPQVQGFCWSFMVTLRGWVWNLCHRGSPWDSLPRLPVSALAVLICSVMVLLPAWACWVIRGYQKYRNLPVLFPLGPFARWDVAFKLRFEKPCGRIFGFLWCVSVEQYTDFKIENPLLALQKILLWCWLGLVFLRE